MTPSIGRIAAVALSTMVALVTLPSCGSARDPSVEVTGGLGDTGAATPETGDADRVGPLAGSEDLADFNRCLVERGVDPSRLRSVDPADVTDAMNDPEVVDAVAGCGEHLAATAAELRPDPS